MAPEWDARLSNPRKKQLSWKPQDTKKIHLALWGGEYMLKTNTATERQIVHMVFGEATGIDLWPRTRAKIKGKTSKNQGRSITTEDAIEVVFSWHVSGKVHKINMSFWFEWFSLFFVEIPAGSVASLPGRRRPRPQGTERRTRTWSLLFLS